MTKPLPSARPVHDLGGLSTLLSVASALDAADESAFEKLRATADPEQFWKDVARVSGYASYETRDGRGLRHQHAVLWMQPVVTLPGHASVINTGLPHGLGTSLMAWLGDWFGAGLEIRMLPVPWSVDIVAGLSPVQLRVVLEVCMGRRNVSELPMPIPDGALRYPSECPQLGFLIGSAARYVLYPRIPDPGGADEEWLLGRMRAAAQYWAGNVDAGALIDHVFGVPMATGLAMRAGLVVWARTCHRMEVFDGWSLQPFPPDGVSLTLERAERSHFRTASLVDENASSGKRGTSLRIPSWQLGDQGVDALRDALTDALGAPSSTPTSAW